RADLGERPPALHLFVGQQEILRARLRPDALTFGLGALDPLQAELRREMDDVHRAAGEASDEDRAVDRLLLGPVGARGGKVRRRRAALGDRLVLEIAE